MLYPSAAQNRLRRLFAKVRHVIAQKMIHQLFADLILLAHAVFVVFVVFGGLLVPRYPKVLWWHLPALFWGIVVQWADWICPLTPLENYFRQLGGDAGYEGGFVEHFVSRFLYPEHLTLELRYLLGLALVLLNVAVYLFVLARRRSS